MIAINGNTYPVKDQIKALGGLLHAADFDHSIFTPLVPELPTPASGQTFGEQLSREHWKVASAHAWIDRMSGPLRNEALTRHCRKGIDDGA